jgi:hypothetical protein
MAAEDEAVRSRIREILLNDWDPQNVVRNPAAHGAYAGYIDPLLNLLRSGADEEQVVEFLHDKEQDMMCFPSLDTRRLRPVARKLLALVNRSTDKETGRTS